jgi:pyrophosphatase PpaX
VSGLDGLFEAIVPSDEVTRPKPHPEPVQRALALLAVDATRSVFVGDSLHDVHCGRAAGVRTAAVLWGPFTRLDLESGQPDYWVESPADLCRVLGLEP